MYECCIKNATQVRWHICRYAAAPPIEHIVLQLGWNHSSQYWSSMSSTWTTYHRVKVIWKQCIWGLPLAEVCHAFMTATWQAPLTVWAKRELGKEARLTCFGNGTAHCRVLAFPFIWIHALWCGHWLNLLLLFIGQFHLPGLSFCNFAAFLHVLGNQSMISKYFFDT